MVAIFVSGFGTSSDSSDTSSTGNQPGVHQMSDDMPKDLKDKIGPAKKFVWDEQDEACAFIEGAIGSNPDQPVVIIGHSFGADSAVEIAEALKEKGICVDLLVQMDSIGAFDEKKPDNVTKGVNLWSSSRDGLNGAEHVDGSENIPVSGTSHTGIDDPDDKGKVDNDSDSPHEGKNAYQIIKDFIAGLKPPYCNKKKADEKAKSAERKQAVRKIIDANPSRAVSILELQEKTKIEAGKLAPAIRELHREGVIKKAAGSERMPYFVPAK